MTPTFSLIIPVYNVENYLQKCLDSVLAQGLSEQELEILLINDGSTDGSLDICTTYAERHPHIRIINQPNQGVSTARNTGIEQAAGEFIGFMDADDYLLDNGLYLATQPFRGRTDIDVIHFFSSYDFWEKLPIDNTVDFDGWGHDYILKSGLPSFCWLCFYKKTFLEHHQIRFKNYRVGEDTLFSSTVYIANPRIVSTRANIYRYVVRDASATTQRSVTHTRVCVHDYLDAYDDLMAVLRRYDIPTLPKVYEKCLQSINSKKMFGFSRILSAEFSTKEYREIQQRCQSIGFYPVLPYANSLSSRLQKWIMNIVLKHRVLYRPAALLFNRFFVPYVLTRLRHRL